MSGYCPYQNSVWTIRDYRDLKLDRIEVMKYFRHILTGPQGVDILKNVIKVYPEYNDLLNTVLLLK